MLCAAHPACLALHSTTRLLHAARLRPAGVLERRDHPVWPVRRPWRQLQVLPSEKAAGRPRARVCPSTSTAAAWPLPWWHRVVCTLTCQGWACHAPRPVRSRTVHPPTRPPTRPPTCPPTHARTAAPRPSTAPPIPLLNSQSSVSVALRPQASPSCSTRALLLSTHERCCSCCCGGGCCCRSDAAAALPRVLCLLCACCRRLSCWAGQVAPSTKTSSPLPRAVQAPSCRTRCRRCAGAPAAGSPASPPTRAPSSSGKTTSSARAWGQVGWSSLRLVCTLPCSPTVHNCAVRLAVRRLAATSCPPVLTSLHVICCRPGGPL